MNSATEPHADTASRYLSRPGSSADDFPECDRCGKALSREAALERVQPGADDTEPVFLCTGCELGGD
ncbi:MULTISPECIES: hypothetical protein [Anaeromyxobacter]|uniref:hypothetical protein n=1 Tax=Anaeromyxobacter TaxID=161492 RepID=UPI001F56020A|nr:MULTISPECIES: hypothetical protein [unclassified Anaeromyxobacter]